VGDEPEWPALSKIGRRKTSFPARDRRIDRRRALLDGGLQFLATLVEARQLGLLLGARHFQQRLGHTALTVTDDAVGHVVEERREAVIVALRDGIVLVVVAAGTLQRQAEENCGRRVHPVGDVLDMVLFLDDAPFGWSARGSG